MLYECASPSGRPAMLMATNGDRAMPMAHCSVANFGPVSFGGRPSNAAICTGSSNHPESCKRDSRKATSSADAALIGRTHRSPHFQLGSSHDLYCVFVNKEPFSIYQKYFSIIMSTRLNRVT